jgi:hypothetical protein
MTIQDRDAGKILMDRTAAIAADTTPEAQAVHQEAIRRLGMAGRAKMAFELSENLRVASEAGVRLRHPDYDDRQVRLAATRLAIGDSLFRQAFGEQDIQP